MIVLERQQQILGYLKKKHFATIKELAGCVFTSESSVRRDIKALETQGLVRQTYGGVVLPEYENAVVPLYLRDQSNTQVKEALAQRAAKHVFDGATIFMDGSSTVRRMVKYLSGINELKIITNNVGILAECGDPRIKVYCTGGLFLGRNNICVGSAAERYVQTINADLFFFSSQALSSEGEISDASEEETALRKAMMCRAKKNIFLCDSSKVGEKRMFVLCTKEDVDEIICDVEIE